MTEEPFETPRGRSPAGADGRGDGDWSAAAAARWSRCSTHGNYTYVVFSIPARGLIGLRTRLLNATQGTAIMHHRFEGYKPLGGRDPRPAQRGAGLDGRRPGGGLRAGRPARAGRDVRRPRRRSLRGDDRRREQPLGRHGRSIPPRRRSSPTSAPPARDENILLKPPRMHDAGDGAGVHRGRRAGRGHAQQDPAPQDGPLRDRAPPPRPPPRLMDQAEKVSDLSPDDSAGQTDPRKGSSHSSISPGAGDAVRPGRQLRSEAKKIGFKDSAACADSSNRPAGSTGLAEVPFSG